MREEEWRWGTRQIYTPPGETLCRLDQVKVKVKMGALCYGFRGEGGVCTLLTVVVGYRAIPDQDGDISPSPSLSSWWRGGEVLALPH